MGLEKTDVLCVRYIRRWLEKRQRWWGLDSSQFHQRPVDLHRKEHHDGRTQAGGRRRRDDPCQMDIGTEVELLGVEHVGRGMKDVLNRKVLDACEVNLRAIDLDRQEDHSRR